MTNQPNTSLQRFGRVGLASRLRDRGRRRFLQHLSRRNLPPRPLQFLQCHTIQSRDSNNWRVAFLCKLPLTRQLVARQAESVTYDSLVNLSSNLKQDLTDGHSTSPVVERTFTFTHTHLTHCQLRPCFCLSWAQLTSLPLTKTPILQFFRL